MHEPRRRFALFGRHFSAPAEWGTRTAQACSSLTDGEFFAEPQRGGGFAVCGRRGRCGARRGGQKGRDTYGFPSSLNSYFSLVRIDWVQTVDCVSRKRTRQSGYLSVSFSAFSQFTDLVLLHRRFTLRRRDIPVSRNIFTCADYPNPAVIADLHSQTVCAALLCRACGELPVCVAVMYLTLRTG